MHYQTFAPHSDLASLVKCYWTLEAPAQPDAQRQLILPDGCMEMAFILGDDIKRYTSGDAFIIQPRAMILGQITQQFYIEPTGSVDSFAVRFYPFGLANFVPTPIGALANTETPLALVFGAEASDLLAQQVARAADTRARIAIVETFLLDRLSDRQTIDAVVRRTIDALFETKGSAAIKDLVKNDPSQKRRLERDFVQKIGMSPKQLGKVIRLQAALNMMLNRQSETLTEIAYESEYYDQAHFIKDFKEFTGMTPTKFLDADEMALSSLLYK
jgi:AraC-like DNA-binding protein